MPLLIDPRFFRLQVCLNLFFLSRSSCLSYELLMLWEIFSPRDCKFSFSVSHSWLNHFIFDLHLILLPLAFHPTSLHASIKVSLSNSDGVSMLLCLTAATNLDWTVYINSDMSSTTGPAWKAHAGYFLLFSCYLKFFWQPCMYLLAHTHFFHLRVHIESPSVQNILTKGPFKYLHDSFLNSFL